MKKLVFTDLDDTLFQSARKHTVTDVSQPLAFLANGDPVSYASAQQQVLYHLFADTATFIPVTARNQDAFSRVRLPFTAEAVINYGGIILNTNQQVDEYWLARSQQLAVHRHQDLLNWQTMLQAENHTQDWRIRIISDFDIPFYLVLKSKQSDLTSVAQAAQLCGQWHKAGLLSDVFIHVNDNNLALIPNWLSKRYAVEYLIERYRAQNTSLFTIGMGDSIVDLGFMGLCDYQLIPQTSQIAQARLGER